MPLKVITNNTAYFSYSLLIQYSYQFWGIASENYHISEKWGKALHFQSLQRQCDVLNDYPNVSNDNPDVSDDNPDVSDDNPDVHNQNSSRELIINMPLSMIASGLI